MNNKSMMASLILFASIMSYLPAAEPGAERIGDATATYAVVVSRGTYGDDNWTKVVTALQKKHKAQVIVYDQNLTAGIALLKTEIPKYVAFVAKPEEANRTFVITTHRQTRKLDDDPYTDVLWGIVTGYEAADALRIATMEKPLVIKRGAAGTGLNLNVFEEGRWFSEGKAGLYCEKTSGGQPEEKTGPADSTSSLVNTINDFEPDFFMTSGHATERDWQPGYSYRNGQFRCRDGTLLGIDLAGKVHPVKSPNPKIFMGAGNCLIGHIPDKECMALAYMHSAGVHQFVGYTVVTWYGAMGWGTKDLFFQLPGHLNAAESFFFGNQAIVAQLEKRFPGMPRETFNQWDMDRTPNLMSKLAASLGYTKPEKDLKDHLGLQWDLDTVAFYGDPAWDARLAAPSEAALTATWSSAEGKLTVNIVAKADVKLSRPYCLWLPERIKPGRVIDGQAFAPVLTDNFLMLTEQLSFTTGQTVTIIVQLEK